MSGTKDGGAKAAATNKAKYGDDFYRDIGARGGKVGNTGGFYIHRDLASTAGAKGGRVSRRTWTAEQRQAQSEYMINRHRLAN
jgi:general stress protein YciG